MLASLPVFSSRWCCTTSLPAAALPRRPLAAASRWLSATSLPVCTAVLAGQQFRHGAHWQRLRHGALASNKPHPSERSTPVWLAIWHIWAGFANSQHRDAAYAASNNICAHFPSLPHRVAAQTDANLSAHLHRFPTPPPYLRRMRLSPGRVQVLDAGYGCSLAGCGVPANHRADESLF